MSGEFFRASGVDTGENANIVFVWCRSDGRDGHVLVGSGHVVRASGGLPPGIQAGQFTVVFQLPPDGSAESIVVTDDKDGKNLLPGVTVIPCVTRAKFQPVAAAAPAVLAVRASGTNGYRRL